MSDAIDELIEEVIVDAYGDYEQLSSFCQAFGDEVRFPFRAQVVGVGVEVTAVDFDGDERRGLLAKCRRAGEPHTVSLLEVTLIGLLPLRTRQLLAAYRRWSGAVPLGFEGPIKPAIDALWPLLGGAAHAPADHRIRDLRVTVDERLTGVLVALWPMEYP